jgi:hypothetical protein
MKDRFISDFKAGKEVEKEICENLKLLHPEARVIEATYVENGYEEIGYDIFIPDIPLTVEVKYDRLSSKTKNYFIETGSNNKPSGLSITKADIWVQVDDDYILWLASESLRYLIREFGIPEINFHKIIPPKSGYLIPRIRLLCSSYTKWVEREECQTPMF